MRPSFISFPLAPPLLSISNIPLSLWELPHCRGPPPNYSTASSIPVSLHSAWSSMPSLTYKNKENWAKLSPVWISLGEVGRGWNRAPRMRVSLRLIRSKLQQLILHSFLLPGLGTRTPPT